MREVRDDEGQFELALSRRLAQLGRRPMDIAQLKRRVEQATAATERPSADGLSPWRRRQSWRSLTAATAAVLFLLAVSPFWIPGPAQVVASPVELASLYQQVITRTSPLMSADSIHAANARIALQWAPTPASPDEAPANVAACCLHHLHGVPITSVHLRYQGYDVALDVAYSNRVISPMGAIIYQHGRRFVTTRHGRLNMVMTRHDRHWLCVTSDMGRQELVNLAAAIRY